MSTKIRRIYLGIPEKLIDVILWVSRKYRTNHLSHIKGGSDIIIEYHEKNKVLGYDWIKYPSRYINFIFKKEFFNDNTTFEDFKKQEQINIIKKEISKVYTRIYEKDNLDNISFDTIWDSSKDNTFPWDNMEQYEDKIKNQRALKQPLPPISVYENDYYFKNNNAVKPFRSFNKKIKKVTVVDDLPF